MTEVVLDASAIIAFLRMEPGAEKVETILQRSCISAVNLAEVFGKMVEHGKQLEQVVYNVERLRILVIPFDEEQARIAASLWAATRAVGMSLGDRACLALALSRKLPAMTAEREAWGKVDVGVKIIKIR